jgi:hypothetical protein
LAAREMLDRPQKQRLSERGACAGCCGLRPLESRFAGSEKRGRRSSFIGSLHEGMHMLLDLSITEEAKVVAISELIQPRTRKRK